MKKLLTLLATLNLVTTTCSTIVSCSNGDTKVNEVDNTSKFDLSNLTDEERNLGIIDGIDDLPNFELIINALQKEDKLKSITSEDITIENITNKSATIIANESSKKFINSAEVSFVYNKVESIDLGKLNDEERNLGIINGIDDLPNFELIINALQKEDKLKSITSEDITIENITNKSATIIANESSKKFINSAEVSFVYNKVESIDLSNLTDDEKKFGEFSGNTNLPIEDAVFNFLKKSEIFMFADKNDIKLSDISKNNVTVTAQNNSKIYKNSAIISFIYINDGKVDLSLLNKDNINIFSKENTLNENKVILGVIEANKKFNIDKSDIMVEINTLNQNSKTAKIVSNSSDKVKNQVNITYIISNPKNVNLKLVEDLIKGQGDYGSLTPAIYKNGLTIDPNYSTSETKVFEAVKEYANKILKLATILGINISIDELISLVNISYYSDEQGTVEHKDNEDIKLLKISIKDKMNEGIYGYYIDGTATAPIYKKIDINTIITEDTIYDVKKGGSNALQAVYIKQSLTAKYKDKMTEFNFTDSCWGTINNKSIVWDDESKKSGSIILPNPDDNFNNIFYGTIKLKFFVK